MTDNKTKKEAFFEALNLARAACREMAADEPTGHERIEALSMFIVLNNLTRRGFAVAAAELLNPFNNMHDEEDDDANDAFVLVKKHIDALTEQNRQYSEALSECESTRKAAYAEIKRRDALAGEPVAEVISGYQIVFVGTGPIGPIIKKHNLRVGDKLYTSPPAASPSESPGPVTLSSSERGEVISAARALTSALEGQEEDFGEACGSYSVVALLNLMKVADSLLEPAASTAPDGETEGDIKDTLRAAIAADPSPDEGE